MTRTYYLDTEGQKHYSLPSIWNNTSPVTEQYMLNSGWTKHTEEVSEPAVTTCTKYEFTKALQEMNSTLYEQLREAYAADTDMQFYWNTVQELDRNNADFHAFQQKMNVTDAQVDEIFTRIKANR